MAVIPFRFVHAAQLMLDEPLRGLAPGLTGEVRKLCEDATLIAWERIVSLCIESQAACLLLVGNSFSDVSGSLRARVALERGCQQLAQHQIAVIAVPGELDPASAWKLQVNLPANVRLLADEHAPPLLIRRGAEVLASVRVLASASADESDWPAGGPAVLDQVHAPFHIGLVPPGAPVEWDRGRVLPVDRPDVPRAAATLIQAAVSGGVQYVALGGGRRQTHPLHAAVGVVHDPGPVQSLQASVSGPCGVSVVDVQENGQTRIAPSTVAPVRWEPIGLELERGDQRSDLVDQMALTLLEREPDSDDELWIVQWKLRGEGKLFESLAAAEAQRELWNLLEREVGETHATRRIHQLQREPLWEKLLAAAEISVGRELLELVEETAVDHCELAREELLGWDWQGAAERGEIAAVLDRLSPEDLVAAARSVGMAALAATGRE